MLHFVIFSNRNTKLMNKNKFLEKFYSINDKFDHLLISYNNDPFHLIIHIFIDEKPDLPLALKHLPL